MSSNSQTFNVSFPKALVDKIDDATREQYGSRSDFLRAAVIEKLRREQEWEELFRYGKEIGKQVGYSSEEEVADAINAERRASGRWFITK